MNSWISGMKKGARAACKLKPNMKQGIRVWNECYAFDPMNVTRCIYLFLQDKDKRVLLQILDIKW